MSDWDKQFKRNLNDVKRGVKNLRKLGLRVEAHLTETMYGSLVYHVYVIDRGARTYLQKHLFTLEETDIRK